MAEVGEDLEDCRVGVSSRGSGKEDSGANAEG